MRQNTLRKAGTLEHDPSQTIIPFPETSQPAVSKTPERQSQPLEPGRMNEVLFGLGIEPSLTVREAAALLRWSHWKARRYFRNIEGICICYQPKRYKRPYRTFTIPISIFAREWQKMTGQQPQASELIRARLLSLVK